jgi:hypothetical protein
MVGSKRLTGKILWFLFSISLKISKRSTFTKQERSISCPRNKYCEKEKEYFVVPKLIKTFSPPPPHPSNGRPFKCFSHQFYLILGNTLIPTERIAYSICKISLAGTVIFSCRMLWTQTKQHVANIQKTGNIF